MEVLCNIDLDAFGLKPKLNAVNGSGSHFLKIK